MKSVVTTVVTCADAAPAGFPHPVRSRGRSKFHPAFRCSLKLLKKLAAARTKWCEEARFDACFQRSTPTSASRLKLVKIRSKPDKWLPRHRKHYLRLIKTKLPSSLRTGPRMRGIAGAREALPRPQPAHRRPMIEGLLLTPVSAPVLLVTLRP